MKPQSASRLIDLPSRKDSLFAENPLASPEIRWSARESRKKLKDAVAFSICFAVVALLTGAMLYLKVAATVSIITTSLFYFGIAGFVVFVVRGLLLSRIRAVDLDDTAASLN